MKVDYLTVSGFLSTAYLDEEVTVGVNMVMGVDKYSDRPLRLTWNGVEWQEQALNSEGR